MSRLLSRRDVLAKYSNGFGLVALSGLLHSENSVSGSTAAKRRGAVVPRPNAPAEHVIFCYMSGGMSHVDSFDPKPRLTQDANKDVPFNIERTQFNSNGKLMPTHWEFKPRGESGLEISELFPHIAQCADDIAVVRSMTADFSEHAQGNFFMHTGFSFQGYPSAGAWVNYGLGNANENLPGFVVLASGGSTYPHGGVGLFGSGFLPSRHQASTLRLDADVPIRNIVASEIDVIQKKRLSFINRLDDAFLADSRNDTNVEAAIKNYEMAYKMQSAVPELVDMSDESAATLELYGINVKSNKTDDYGRQCLMARRMVERGVRFIELSCLAFGVGGGGAANPWDNHGNIKNGHQRMGQQIDQPIAGLIKDLKQRGLLEKTLVVCAGEFGRTPFSQSGSGRDHDPYGFSIWMAGGGIKGGVAYGATDEFGYHAVENITSVYDMWATVLYLMGIDHEELTYRHGGRDIRLTDVHGDVLHDIIA